VDGFDLHAGVAVSARNRARLEQLCRYALRPAVGQDRLQAMPDSTVALELRRRWTDGTTHLIFDPIELLERLAALVPRPRINLVLYYGVFAPRAAGRRAIVPARDAPADGDADRAGSNNASWAELMQRSFGFDVLACARCGGRLRLVALIHQPAVIRRILTHLGLPVEAPVVAPVAGSPGRGVDGTGVRRPTRSVALGSTGRRGAGGVLPHADEDQDNLALSLIRLTKRR
jgi:hypothetical protein